MAWGSLKLRPGVNVEMTPALNEAGISSSCLIRFWQGLPQKYGGWEKFYASPMSGVVRGLHAWQDLIGTKHLAVGTDNGLFVLTSGTAQEITPYQLSTNPFHPLGITNGSATVVVTEPAFATYTLSTLNVTGIKFNIPAQTSGTAIFGVKVPVLNGSGQLTVESAGVANSTIASGGDPPLMQSTNGTNSLQMRGISYDALGFSAGSQIYIPTTETLAGQTITGIYYVYSMQSLNEALVHVSGNFSSSTSKRENNGNLSLTYYLAPNSGITLPSGTTAVTGESWSFDNWGGTLIANPRNGPIFYFDPQNYLSRAAFLMGGPSTATGIFIAMPQQMIVAYGCNAGDDVVQDPLLVRWCSVADYNSWIADSTNQAGSFRIPTGSKIVGGLQGPQQALLFTDIDVWAMQYLGAPLVWGFTKLYTGCGLISQKAVCAIGNKVLWMSQKQFFMMDGAGSAQPIPCTVWDVLFQSIDPENPGEIVAAPNSQFREVAWHFKEGGGDGENDSWVKVNIDTLEWDYSLASQSEIPLGRSAWIDQSVLGPPIGANPVSMYIYQHETSDNADGAAMDPFIRTGWAAVSEGLEMVFIDEIRPDMVWGDFDGDDEAVVRFTVYAADWPGQPSPEVKGPFSVTRTAPFFNPRIRARYIMIEIASDDLDSFWRLGNNRYRFKITGRR